MGLHQLHQSYPTHDRPSRNIELKARCADLPNARAAALKLGAAPADLVRQIDTYFRVPTGRLKLRQIDRDGSTAAELIAYARPDSASARASEYRVVPVPDAAALLAALAETVGVRGVVRKAREVLLWRNVRIHLDEVEGAGTFVEFEAVVGPGFDDAASRDNLERAAAALGVKSSDAVEGSYIDLG